MTPAHDSLRRLANVVLVLAVCLYLVALLLPAVRTWGVCISPAGRITACPIAPSGFDMLTGRAATGAWSWIEIGLWSLNVVPLATWAMWKRPRRAAWVLGPAFVGVVAYWAWGSTPSAPVGPQAWAVWVPKCGYFMWLIALGCFGAALTLRWAAHAIVERLWARFRPEPVDIELDAAALAHLSPTLRSAVVDAATLREILGTSPRDDRVRRMVWQWVLSIRRLPDRDAAELERLRIHPGAIEAAAAPLWDVTTEAGPLDLARMIDTFDTFIAAARGRTGLAYR